MVRPRTVLLASFPDGTVTPDQASNALRKAGGDIETAKRALQDVKNKKQPERCAPKFSTAINNLSDRQYCCVWHVEVFEDGYRPEVARALLARVARHVNPILRDRGWRVKRLMESSSRQWIGCCTTNGRSDADAASTNIQLNLRVQPTKHCQTFRSFSQILAVMLHEITHTSIGLEDIHPPAFFELLNEIKYEHRTKLASGEVTKETDDYGCNNTFVSTTEDVQTAGQATSNVVVPTVAVDYGPLSATGDECGATKRRRRGRRPEGKKRRSGTAMGTVALQRHEKRRPLLKGTKMIDKRTKVGKAVMAESESVSPRELAARAALARFNKNNGEGDGGGIIGGVSKADSQDEDGDGSNTSEEDSDVEEDSIDPHVKECACRGCGWDKMLFLPKTNVSSIGTEV